MCNQAAIKLRDLPASVSQVTELKAGATIPHPNIIYIYFYYVCVHMCTRRGYWYLCVCVWKQENAGCFPPSLSTLFFETGSLIESKVLNWWPSSFQDPPVSTFQCWDYRQHSHT